MTQPLDIIPHGHKIKKADRARQKGHQSAVVWFTGLSGSGKSTIADATEQLLLSKNIHTYILDGDNVRMGLNSGLGFSQADRKENLRRIAEVAKLFADAGLVILSAFVSPMRVDREMVKNIVGSQDFVEVFVNTSLEECERRDVKGLYQKARRGEIANFTGIQSPYEAPQQPELIIETESCSPQEAAEKVVRYLIEKNIIKPL